MSELIYLRSGSGAAPKPLVWLHGAVRSPPLSQAARVEIGFLLRHIQRGGSLGMPDSRPMPAIGGRCHEMRVRDGSASWRLVYRIDSDAIVIADVFAKKTRATPQAMIDRCRDRYRRYDGDGKGP
jgi:phage-related protein